MAEPIHDKVKRSLQAADGMYHRLVLLAGEAGSGIRRCVLNDLSPEATFIGANYNLPFDVNAFSKSAKKLLKDVEKEIGWMYETLHTDGKTKGRIEYTVWSEVFTENVVRPGGKTDGRGIDMYENISDLLKQIALGEDSVLELKAVNFSGNKVIGPHKDGMADELAAMANTASGIIVLGVDDNTREIRGIPPEKLDIVEGLLRSICNDSIDPPLDCVIRKLIVPDQQGVEKAILRIDVPRSLFVHKSPNGYFRRIGSSKREMKPDVLARLFQQRSQARLIRFDEQIVPGTSLRDLNPKLWSRFRTVISPKADLEFLEKMKLVANDEDGTMRATVSGILMASDAPESFMSSAFIQAVCYRGIERNAAWQLDAKDITGPLDIQIRDACKFVERNMRVFAIKAPHRIETPQFSMNAVFEAVVNAVAHRDYSIYGSKIRLHLFSDRLEIFSPGAIPNTMTIESISERQSARNELISSLLARCPMNVDAIGSQRNFIMDKRGEGVPIIITESEKLSGRKPLYRLLDDSELMLTIFAALPPHAED